MAESLRILIAPDKFKGTLTAVDAASAIASGICAVMPDAVVQELPIADGGEGTVDVVDAAGGLRHSCSVKGPVGGVFRADWASIGGWAVVELAAACGLQLLEPSIETARLANTEGAGEMILDALDQGFRRIALGLGGSASTDGGTGLLHALGARFLGPDGREITPNGANLRSITEVDLAGLDTRLGEAEIVACCDVEAPLLGLTGAAAVYGPQKGADFATVAELDAGLANLATALRDRTGRDAASIAWGGAAGGVAGGLYAALGSRFESGFDRVADLLDLDRRLDHTDLVVVGEGRLDHQSITGKAPIALARRARARSIPVLAVVGELTVDEHSLAANGISVAASTLAEAGSAAAAVTEPALWVTRAAQTAIRHHLAGDHHMGVAEVAQTWS
ncbi:glycerate kinase [Rhodococcus pseudokoreensis]|uniref:Glycerate kinase n=1 Tax=Rhodococcus pseudokoreensis TaxID=2811421 RepID=A0A974W2L1_9NOCA|nr:glycerate kinase [Rhodococcus pseudokoreensis]QSE89809.1 glycerate kinase [Rhodococcus pseudokoreensis]